MQHQLRRLAFALTAAFVGVALAAGYWTFVRRETLLARTDNPRRILAERASRRGTIFGRNSQVLAESVGEPGQFVRAYPYPDLAPVLGYVSAFYGSAGVESAADGVLHGDAGYDPLDRYWRETVFASPPPGRAVYLTIDLGLQQVADAELGDRIGAVVLVTADGGDILAMASHPTYDANRLDADWSALVTDARAPLLNRATQALYPPGAALAPLVLAAALENNATDLKRVYPFAALPVAISDSIEAACRVMPRDTALTLPEALLYGCPAPFAEVGRTLGVAALARLFNDFRLLQPPAIPLPAASAQSGGEAGAPDLAAIGQGPMRVTPLHMALAAAAMARDGRMPAPILITAEMDPAGVWRVPPPASHPIAALPPEFARQVKTLIPDGHSAQSITTAGEINAWYWGFAPFDDARYAVAVLLEDGDVAQAKLIGRRLLQVAVERTP